MAVFLGIKLQKGKGRRNRRKGRQSRNQGACCLRGTDGKRQARTLKGKEGKNASLLLRTSVVRKGILVAEAAGRKSVPSAAT